METIRKVIKIGNRYIGLEKYGSFQIGLDLSKTRGGISLGYYTIGWGVLYARRYYSFLNN